MPYSFSGLSNLTVMNILFYYDKGVLPSVGGIAKITYNLINLFRQNGHKVWIVSIKKLYEANYDQHQYFVPSSNKISKENVDFIVNLIKEFRIDVVINQCAMSYQDSAILLKGVRDDTKVKVLSCIHNSTMTPARNFAYQKEYMLRSCNIHFLFGILNSRPFRYIYERLYIHKYSKMYKSIIDSCDGVLLLSNALKQEFLKVCNIKECDKLFVVPNVNVPNDQDIEKNNKENIILWVGNTDFTVKRLDSMLRVWKRCCQKLPDWTLYILGDGPALGLAKQFADDNNLSNIVFTGRVTPNEYYEKAKYLMMTSSHEAFPMVILESFSNGVVPIIYNSFPTASDVVANRKNGLLLDPFKENKAAKILVEILKNEDNYTSMVKNGQITNNIYSPEKVYESWNKIFKSIKLY